MIDVCKEYGLSDCVRNAIESGNYMSKYLWKNTVKHSLEYMEHTRWVIRCKIYKSLNYIAVDNNRICTWWIHAYYDNSFARKNRVIVKLLLNVYSYLDQICPCCQLNTVNNVVHILFVC